MRLDRIVAEDVGKRFGRHIVFAGLHAAFEGGETIAITGRNGSGKSTLLRILAGLLTPTFGSVKGFSGTTAVSEEMITRQTGFVAPYLNVYDSFTARENLQFIARARRIPQMSSRIEAALGRVGLADAADAPVSTLSSGMTQRVRLAAAALHEPSVLMFDEPGTNLDRAGRGVVRDLIAEYRGANRLVIVATNDEAEAALCDREICVTDLQSSSR